MLSVLIWHLDFSYFPTTMMWLPSVFSINMFMAVILMSSPPCYLDRMSFSVPIDWQLGFTVVLWKWLDVTVRSILIVFFSRTSRL